MGGTLRERATRFWTLTLIGLPAAVVPLNIAAQSATVVGVVTERDTGAPLQGVYVALVAQDGGVVQAAALTGESGRVMLRAAVGATYRLRAERVGMASVTTDPFTLTDESMIHRVSLAEEAIEVEGLTVPTPVRLCDIDAAEALRSSDGGTRSARRCSQPRSCTRTSSIASTSSAFNGNGRVTSGG